MAENAVDRRRWLQQAGADILAVSMDRNLALEVVRVTEAAALAASSYVGLGQRDETDRAATEAMLTPFGCPHFRGSVAITHSVVMRSRCGTVSYIQAPSPL